MLEDVLSCKTSLTVNAIALKAANTKTWNNGACTYQNTADNYGNTGALCY